MQLHMPCKFNARMEYDPDLVERCHLFFFALFLVVIGPVEEFLTKGLIYSSA
jgi:hypothetical protein